MQQEAKRLVWLNEREDININDLVNMNKLSEIYSQAKIDYPDISITALLHCIVNRQNGLPKNDPPLHSEIMFLKCCESIALAQNALDQLANLKNIDKYIIVEGFSEAISNTNPMMCQFILSQMTPEIIAELPDLYRNKKTGELGILDKIQLYSNCETSSERFQVAEQFRTQLREPCATLFYDIRRSCKEMDAVLNKFQKIQEGRSQEQIAEILQME